MEPHDRPLKERIADVPQTGTISWVGLRPKRGEPMLAVAEANALAGKGLEGDRVVIGARNGKRQITLIQAEHLDVIARLSGHPAVSPEVLRRNIVVAGINLIALRTLRFRIGDQVVLEGTGPCEPCSKMDVALGVGGFQAMRGHGGITTRVLEGGIIRIGDAVRVLALASLMLLAQGRGARADTPAVDDAHFRATAALALSPDGRGHDDTGCTTPPSATRLRCLIDHRYAGDARARERVHALYTRHRIAVGVEREHDMDGGFRGLLHLVPEWPLGRHARHLAYIADAHDGIERTLAGLRARSTRPVAYRHQDIVYRFFRSVGRTTPSAYASSWTIGYNVSGSLNRSAASVRATIVHEVFHLNDEAAGYWSESHLGEIHARIVARCGVARPCLAPYAPTRSTVRGGTYYSFQPDNGSAVVEYAAEIASRYVDEHTQMLERGRLREPAWKCKTPENGAVYALVANGFFGGVDLTPSCTRQP